MKPLVKICGMRDPQNIAEALSLSPDLMGFIFYDRSPRCAEMLDPQVVRAIPASTGRVGVFVNAPTEDILQKTTAYSLTHIQLHGDESPELCERLRDRDLHVIKAFGIDASTDFSRMEPYESCCDLFVFDTRTPAYGGSGESFDWTLLNRYTGQTPFLLSGGIGPGSEESLRHIIHPMFRGIDLNSRFETVPGLKSISLLRNFLNTYRS